MVAPVAPHVEQDIVDLALQAFHKVDMMFSPIAWAGAPVVAANWTKSDFPPQPRTAIPKKPGVYVFVVMTELFGFPHASGLFYIGKASNLYDRVGAYTGDVNTRLIQTRRPLVWRMLNQWHGHLYYFYTITANAADAATLESQMIEAFRPPFNKRYEGVTSATMRAFI